MKKRIKKYFALVLSMAMIVTSLPVTIFATDEREDVNEPLRTILTVDTNQSTTIGRIHKLYLATDEDNPYFAYFKINATRAMSTSGSITWKSADESIARVDNSTGSNNTIRAVQSGETKVTISCDGRSTDIGVVVKNKSEIKARLVELAKLLPEDSSQIKVADLNTVDEFYSLRNKLNMFERSALGKIEGNEAFKRCNSTDYNDTLSSIYAQLTSTNVAMSNGADYESLVDTCNELSKDRDYLSESQKASLDEIKTLMSDINRDTMSQDILASVFTGKVGAIRGKVKAYVGSLLTDLPSAALVNLNDKNMIIVARNAYSALATADQASVAELIKNKLVPAENAIKEIESIVHAESISVDPTEKTISIGASTSLSYEITPAETTNQNVTWSSDNEEVATVDGAGKVKGVSEGVSHITVKTSNDKSALATIIVEDTSVPVDSITLEKKELTLTMGTAETLKASVLPEEATVQEVTWESDNKKVATVDENGQVIGIEPGTANITVKSDDSKSTVSDTCKVTVAERNTKTEPTVYFQYSNGLIQEMDSNGIFTLEQSAKGKFCLEGSEITPYWKTDGNSTDGFVCQVYAGAGTILPKALGETKAWAIDDETSWNLESKHIVDFKIKIVPSTISSIKLYIDGQEVSESSNVELFGSESKSIKVMGKRDNETYYTEVPYYAVDYTGPNDVSFGTSTQSNTFAFDNPGVAIIKVGIKNSNVYRSFKATSQEIKVTDIVLDVPETFYIDDWNGNGGEYVGLTSDPYGTKQHYSINVLPNDASNQGVSWESYNEDVAVFKVAHINGFLPLKAGVAKFRVTSNSDSSIYKDVSINFEYKNKATSVSLENNNLNVKLSDGSVLLPFKFTSDTGNAVTEQRMDWSYSENGIVRGESSISTETGTKVTKHTLTPLKEGSVTVTATPWDTTGGAKPISFNVKVEKGEIVSIDVNKVINNGKTAAINHLKPLASYEYNDEWSLFSLVRSGVSISAANKDKYYQSVVNRLKTDSRFGSKSTDISRVIIAMQAIGLDARNVGGTNLLAKIYNYNDSLETMGSNDLAFALIALDSNKTAIPSGANWSRDRLVSTLLKYQVASGGFSLSMPKTENDSSSIDMTCMSITGLSPYKDNAKVKVAIDKAVDYLRKNIDSKAGYDGNSNSVAQVITALSVNEIDFMKSANGFTVGVNSLLTNVDSFRVGTTGFKYKTGDKEINGMASQQVLYGLEAYRRFLSNSHGLYDFKDVNIQTYNEFKNGNPAVEVISKISKIGKVTYSSECKTKIDTARAAYNSLSTANKAKVTNYKTLTDAESAYKLAEAKYKFSKSKFSLSYTTAIYTGKDRFPTVTVKYGSNTLKKNTDYTVSYKNNKYIGAASVTIKGKGKYSGTKTLTFKIIPQKQVIRSLSKGTKKFTVKWTKNTAVTAYQIVYAKNSKFTKSCKTLYVKNKYTTYKTVSGLSRHTTYYVKVRSYKYVSGKPYYGSWSTVKIVKTM